MSISAETLRRLAALRLDPEAMGEVLSIIADMQAAEDERKEKDRNRKRNVRGNSKENPRNVQGNGAEIPSPASPEVSPPRDITQPPNPNPTSSLRSDSAASKSKRGSRLPDNFQPDHAAEELAAKLGVPLTAVHGELLAEFGDYWRGVPGARGVKLDWQGTFRNRLRERAPKYQARAGPSAPNPPKKANPYYSAVRQSLEKSDKNERFDNGANLSSEADRPGAGARTIEGEVVSPAGGQGLADLLAFSPIAGGRRGSA